MKYLTLSSTTIWIQFNSVACTGENEALCIMSNVYIREPDFIGQFIVVPTECFGYQQKKISFIAFGHMMKSFSAYLIINVDEEACEISLAWKEWSAVLMVNYVISNTIVLEIP